MMLMSRAFTANAVTESNEVETIEVDDSGVVVSRPRIPIKVFRQALVDGVWIDMVLVPGGTFSMGSPHSKGHLDEEPQRIVHVRDFHLGQVTITQQQWHAVMKKAHPCRGKGPENPVDRVSWNDAQRFCEKLSKLSKLSYRLPSEAEWEYACRAGSSGDFSWGNMITTKLANYVGLHAYMNGPKGEYRHGPIRSKQFPPNRFGLYDMHGNLDAWCMDSWHENYTAAPLDFEPWIRGGTEEKVIRGGSWHDPPTLCRSAARLKLNPSEGEDFMRMRVALS
jgi:formylglycine-generating enzyme required for sulfatase activity